MLFEQAEIARFDATEMKDYEDSVNAYRDIVNAIKTAEKIKFAEGRAEGRAEGVKEGKDQRSVEIARSLVQMGLSASQISKATGLTEQEIMVLGK